jgi:hypothetical protein
MTTADREGKRKGNHCGDQCRKYNPAAYQYVLPARANPGSYTQLSPLVQSEKITRSTSRKNRIQKKHLFFLIIAGTSIPPLTGKKEKLSEIAL